MMPKNNVLLQWVVRGGLVVGVGLLPLIIGVGLFRVLMIANLSDTTPTWSDEIYYWHQATTFRMVGFNGGYYTANEQPAPAHFTRYYAWGAAVPAIYGIQARLLGWSLYAIPLLNMTFLGAALVIFLIFIQATRWQMMMASVILVTFAPFLLFSASSMLEVQQQGIAVLLATAFYRLLRRHHTDSQHTSLWQWMGLIVLMGIAILLRPTWAILFVPLCMLALRRPTVVTGIVAMIFGVMLFVFSGWLTQLMAAPDVEFVEGLRAIIQDFPSRSIPVLGLRVIKNLRLALGGHPIEIHNRLLFFVLLASIGITWLRQRHQRRTVPIPTLALTQAEVLLHLYNIGVMLVFNLVLYDTFDWRDYRVMTPHLLLSLLLLVACRRYRLVITMIIALMLILPLIPATYRSPDWYGKHANKDRLTLIQQWSDRYSPIMIYQPNATSAWCNTLLHTPFYLFGPFETLLAVPPGIGVSAILGEDRLVFPLKSRYLLLDNEFYRRYAARLRLQPLLPVPHGMLSLNLDANCGKEH